MAAANNGPRFTRSRKTTTPNEPTEKPAYEPQPRSLRSSKTASTGIVLKDNCVVVIQKLQSENTKQTKNIKKAERQSPARKRTRVDNGDVRRDESDSKNKRTRLMAQKKTETGERASSRREKEAQSTSKQRIAKKSVVLTEESHDSSALSEVESEDQENSSDSKSESGMASGYSSSVSSTSHRESDSPVPTSELSDSSDGIESSSDESSSSEDVLRWHTRKSPRKLAQAKSREKIAELCKPESDDTLSPLSSDSSYSE